MRVELPFKDSDARAVTAFLRARYKSKAGLKRLCMIAVRREVAEQAKAEMAAADACSRCGAATHEDQREAFPVGAEVVATSEHIAEDVAVGALGRVFAHCEDGRAMITFGDKPTHTFHQPEGYVARVARRGK